MSELEKSDRPEHRRSPGRLASAKSAVAGAAAGAMLLLPATDAQASHTLITSNDKDYISLPVSGGQSWNGHLVYLSSPRHADSGNRGELGWEENINGRHWNVYVANGSYVMGQSNPTSQFRNLNARGYKVRVSSNQRDNGWKDNRTKSNNWGATVHHVTHTNATQGTYTLAMYRANDQVSIDYANDVADWTNVPVPGGRSVFETTGDEINSLNDAPNVVYSELFFHDTQMHVDWFEAGGGAGDGVKWASVIGTALDIHLNYP